MKKSFIVPVVVALVAAGGVAFATSSALAQTVEDGEYSPLVTRLSQRFGLNQGDVQAVFDEEHKARQAEIQVRLEEQLNEAVADGNLTEEQKQKILAKHAELKAERESNWESWRSLTQEERRSQMEQRHEEMETWLEENGIDEQYLMMKFKFGDGEGRVGEGRGMGGGMMRGSW